MDKKKKFLMSGPEVCLPEEKWFGCGGPVSGNCSEGSCLLYHARIVDYHIEVSCSGREIMGSTDKVASATRHNEVNLGPISKGI